jgi:hypothetical protein
MVRSAGWAAVLLLAAACGSGASTGTDLTGADVPSEGGDEVLADALDASDVADVPDVPDGLPEGVAWAVPDRFPLDGTVPAQNPQAFARISRYATHVTGPVAARPNVGHRGAFGTGNGRVFGFVGLADPLNTLHSLIGPTYERRANFFGDYAIRLARAVDATPPDFDEEWAGRSLSAPVVVTRGRLGDLELDTIDLAPPAGSVEAPVTCFLRQVIVRNRGTVASQPLAIVVVPTNPVTSPEGGTLLETQAPSDGRIRRLATQFQGVDGTTASVVDGRLVLGLEPMAPGSESVHLLSHCTGDALAETPEAEAVPGWFTEDPSQVMSAILGAAATAYTGWEAGTVQADVPDPMVADFLDGMKMTLKVQTAATGATCPMSQYTRTWARDNIGPVMALLAYGAFEDVEAMLDYVYAAIRYAGDLKNSYDADLDVGAAPPAPEWAAMAPLEGRVAGETPSYMVTMYGLHHRYTGDKARAMDRWGLLRRCLFAQGFGIDRLLPFTGDETYRAAMNAAFGLDLEYAHHDLTWSANSTFLWLGAARELDRLAGALDKASEVEEVRTLSAEVERDSVPRFQRSDGCMAAFAWMDTLQMSLPFEDVALQVTWSGWKDGDDPLAQSSLDCLVKQLGRAPGEIVSRPDPLYAGTFAWEGVYTGMLPGYTLAAMTDAGHPQAAAAFAAVRTNLDTSGNLVEYMIYDDHSGLSVAYDPVGALGDYTTKFRPWEGGIVAEAALRYLVGFRPDATTREITLRPHLPAGWPRMAFRGLRAGGERFDLFVERGVGGEAVVQVTRRAGSADLAAWHLALRWDAPSGAPDFEVDGVPVATAAVQRWTSLFQTTSAQSPAIDLAPGATVAIRVRAQGL